MIPRTAKVDELQKIYDVCKKIRCQYEGGHIEYDKITEQMENLAMRIEQLQPNEEKQWPLDTTKKARNYSL